MDIQKELKRTADFHGVPYSDTVALYQRLLSQGARPDTAITAIRCGYAMASGKHEYFNAQDLAAAFDMPEEEAVRCIEECEDKLTVHYPDWMQ